MIRLGVIEDNEVICRTLKDYFQEQEVFRQSSETMCGKGETKCFCVIMEVQVTIIITRCD